METTDYTRMRGIVLKARAAMGDSAAVAEIARRGAPAPDDLAGLSYRALRETVLAWSARRGDGAEDLPRRRELALRAQAELLARRRVVERLGWRDADLDYYGPDLPVPTPPWSYARQPRCQSWVRPQGSTLYPSETDLARRALNELAREHYKAAGVPQRS